MIYALLQAKLTGGKGSASAIRAAKLEIKTNPFPSVGAMSAEKQEAGDVFFREA